MKTVIVILIMIMNHGIFYEKGAINTWYCFRDDESGVCDYRVLVSFFSSYTYNDGILEE